MRLDTGPVVERLLAAGDARQARPPARAKRLREAQALIRRRGREARVGLAERQQGSGAARRRWGRPGLPGSGGDDLY